MKLTEPTWCPIALSDIQRIENVASVQEYSNYFRNRAHYHCLYAENTYNASEWDLVDLSSFMSTDLYSDLKSNLTPIEEKFKILNKIKDHLDKYQPIISSFSLAFEGSNTNPKVIKIHEYFFNELVSEYAQDNYNKKVCRFLKGNPFLLRSITLLYTPHNPKNYHAKHNDLAQSYTSKSIFQISKVDQLSEEFNLSQASGHFLLFLQDFLFLLSVLCCPDTHPDKLFSFPAASHDCEYQQTIRAIALWVAGHRYVTEWYTPEIQKVIDFQWDRMLMLTYQFAFVNHYSSILQNEQCLLTDSDNLVASIKEALIHYDDVTCAFAREHYYHAALEYEPLDIHDRKNLLLNNWNGKNYRIICVLSDNSRSEIFIGRIAANNSNHYHDFTKKYTCSNNLGIDGVDFFINPNEDIIGKLNILSKNKTLSLEFNKNNMSSDTLHCLAKDLFKIYYEATINLCPPKKNSQYFTNKFREALTDAISKSFDTKFKISDFSYDKELLIWYLYRNYADSTSFSINNWEQFISFPKMDKKLYVLLKKIFESILTNTNSDNSP